MERVGISELDGYIGKKVRISGWLYNLRLLGAISFLFVQDGNGIVQVVLEDKEIINKVKNMQPGTVLNIEALVQEAKQTQLGVELVSPDIDIEVEITKPWPIDISKRELEANIDTVLDFRALSLRHPKSKAIFRIQSSILTAFAHSMIEQGFTQFVSPVLMGAPSESGADVFEVKYFDEKAYLAQSPQVYKQIMVGVFDRVFTIAKVFRAEKHNTSRHLMEITQLDGEMGFIKSFDEVLDVVEKVVRDIFDNINEHNKFDLELLGISLPVIPEGKFPRIKVKEALKKIESRIGKSASREELDVDPEDEREIAKWAKENHDSDFVWLLNFKANKNFYTWDNPEDSDESLSYDLVCRGLEWLSGTHRIHKYDILLERFKKQGLKEEHYEHYLQAFEYGMPSEGGFSLGLERMTQQIVGVSNIREATLFPSDLKRIAGAKIHKEIIKGGEEVSSKIKSILDSRNIEYKYLEHERTVTSEDSARVRGDDIASGVKALILKSKKDGENIMLCLTGDKKIDFKKLKKLLGDNYTFEDKEIIKDKFGLEIGGIPPFGSILGMQTYFDENIKTREIVNFNCGTPEKSISMRTSDLLEVSEGEVIDAT